MNRPLVSWTGPMIASKSLYNRALIQKLFFPSLQILGETDSDDVVQLQNSIASRKWFVGLAGTGLRFLALALSRTPGVHQIEMQAQLRGRPQQGLEELLSQLGVDFEWQDKALCLVGQGWQNSSIKISQNQSSQYLSGLFLSAWQLSEPLAIELTYPKAEMLSKSYLDMTLHFLKELGLAVSETETGWLIPANQQCLVSQIVVEPDMSSIFSLVAATLRGGKSVITNFVQSSVQPDFEFLKILNAMGVSFTQDGTKLTVLGPQRMVAGQFNLKNTPDLFPCLAALLAFAEGESLLFGAEHLEFKESQRISKTAELLTKAGVPCQQRKDGLAISGCGGEWQPQTFSFDADHDHRMAMAAALFWMSEPCIEILGADSVSKSFPGFWQIFSRDRA